MSTFKTENSFEKRLAESTKILKKYQDRVPIIVERGDTKTDTKIPDIDKKKYLVPRDITVSQFLYVIRKRVKMDADQAIFIFVNNSIPAASDMISSVYEANKEKDGFLYVVYNTESTFG